MQHNLREFLRHGGSGRYVFTRQNGAVYGYRAGISIKSLFPGYADLRADFTDQLDRVIADNTRMLLNALTPPDTVPWVTEADPEVNARMACLNDLYRTIAAERDDVEVVDLATTICPTPDRCLEEIDGVDLREDTVHFRGASAEIVARLLVPEVLAAAG